MQSFHRAFLISVAFFLSLITFNSFSSAPNGACINALCGAETDGALKVDTSNGLPVLEFYSSKAIDDLAVHERWGDPVDTQERQAA